MTEMEQDTFITVQFKNAVTGEITGEPVELPVNTSVAILTKLCNSLLEKVNAAVFIANFLLFTFKKCIITFYELINIPCMKLVNVIVHVNLINFFCYV